MATGLPGCLLSGPSGDGSPAGRRRRRRRRLALCHPRGRPRPPRAALHLAARARPHPGDVRAQVRDADLATHPPALG